MIVFEAFVIIVMYPNDVPSYAMDVVVNVPSFPVESTANVLFKFIIYFLCTVTFLLIRWSAYLLPA